MGTCLRPLLPSLVPLRRKQYYFKRKLRIRQKGLLQRYLCEMCVFRFMCTFIFTILSCRFCHCKIHFNFSPSLHILSFTHLSPTTSSTSTPLLRQGDSTQFVRGSSNRRDGVTVLRAIALHLVLFNFLPSVLQFRCTPASTQRATGESRCCRYIQAELIHKVQTMASSPC